MLSGASYGMYAYCSLPSHSITSTLTVQVTPRSFFDEDTTPLVEEFTEWHVARHGGPPDRELTEILAGEWQDGILPQTTYCVSPQRIDYQLRIIGDTFEPETVMELRNLIRIWSRWLGERDGLPEDLLAQVDRATRAPSGQKTFGPSRPAPSLPTCSN